MAGRRARKALRILIGTAVMIILVAIPLVVLSRYAGDWGVPYFGFSSERGSSCTNDWAGYHCDDVTVEDLRWWGEMPLPDSSTVISSYYKATHDFQLDAVVEVPKEYAGRTERRIEDKFGDCRSDRPASLQTDGLTKVCVRANDASDPGDTAADLANTLYVITTGRTSDGALKVGIHQESR